MTREGMFRKNNKDSGHYHSNWLSMMYPRLFLARNLLREDGVIFVSIDDNEVHNLRLMMNEVFGEENFIAQFIWKSRQIVDSRALNGVSNDHEYIVVYSKLNVLKLKGKEIDVSKYSNPDNDPRGSWMSNSILGLATEWQRPNLHYPIIDPETGNNFNCPPSSGWRYSKETMQQKIDEKRIVFPKKLDGRPREKKFLSELGSRFTNISSVFREDTGYTLNGTREVREIINGNYFPFPKPVSLLSILINQGTSEEQKDIVLDFFSGSGTTAHAVLDLNKEDGGNRKFIMIQLPEKCDEKSEAFKAGYKTIAEIGKERIRRVIEKIKADKQSKLDIDGATGKQDLGFKVFKLQQSNFKIWRSDVKTEEELVTQLTLHTDPVDENAKIENILYELLLKSGVPLTARIEEKGGYYLVNDGEIALMLEKANESIIKKVIAENPNKVITLDRLFNNNDQLKTNTALQMKDAGIEFKAV